MDFKAGDFVRCIDVPSWMLNYGNLQTGDICRVLSPYIYTLSVMWIEHIRTCSKHLLSCHRFEKIDKLEATMAILGYQ